MLLRHIGRGRDSTSSDCNRVQSNHCTVQEHVKLGLVKAVVTHLGTQVPEGVPHQKAFCIAWQGQLICVRAWLAAPGAHRAASMTLCNDPPYCVTLQLYHVGTAR